MTAAKSEDRTRLFNVHPATVFADIGKSWCGDDQGGGIGICPSSRRRSFSQVEESPNEDRNARTHPGRRPIFRFRILVEMLPSIHRLHRFHGLHLSDFLIRFFKHQFFRILQLGLASHQFDLITVDPDKPNAIFALNTENGVLAGPK
jgi:hypothetical protein